MNIPPLLTWLFLGHVVADFYLQGKATAKKKNENFLCLLAHGAMYALCMAAVLLLSGAPCTYPLQRIFLTVTLSHAGIDYLKRHFIKDKPSNGKAPKGRLCTCVKSVCTSIKRFIARKIFTIDQLIHIAIIIAAWILWGRDIQTRSLAEYAPEALSISVLPAMLGFLCIIRPVGMLIESGNIWDFKKKDAEQSGADKQSDADRQKNAGKMIGYLERIIVFFLLLHGQFSAIAFVMAAKSVARFPEIKNDKGYSQAEYYLIGTLLSMTSVFAIFLLLGLGNA